jgi:hypothetical protein
LLFLPAVGFGNSRRFIPGVYNYCDRWCERCRFQMRCRVFRDVQRYEEALARGSVPDAAADDADEIPDRPRTASEELDWKTLLAEANRPPTREERAALHERERRVASLVQRDRLTTASRECDELALRLLPSLTAIIAARDDPALTVALETISRFTYMISIKTRRAVHGWYEVKEDAKEDDDLDDDSLNDVHGTVKLVRLILRETCGAWTIVQQAGLAEGAPALMIERLRRLDAALAERFPRAMTFKRPGWDEEVLD